MIQYDYHTTIEKTMKCWHDALAQIQQLDEDWQLEYSNAISIMLAELAPLHPTSFADLLDFYASGADTVANSAACEVEERNEHLRLLSKELLKDTACFVWLHELLRDLDTSTD